MNDGKSGAIGRSEPTPQEEQGSGSGGASHRLDQCKQQQKYNGEITEIKIKQGTLTKEELLLDQYRQQLKEKVEGMYCDLCGKKNKMWDNQKEKYVKCPGVKHDILNLLESE